MRLAYLTGEYPRATDTFIQREVEGLRQLGSTVLTCSIRPTGVEHLVGPEQRAERERTFYVLPINPLAVLFAHLTLAIARPFRYLKALALAASTSAPGIKALLYQLFYFLEAGVLAKQLQQQEIEHLHNHIADSSCTVAMLAAELAGIPFSFTLHGPYIFYEPRRWRLDTKIAKAAFVSCISHFCRSQAMLFSAPEQWDKLHIIHCGVDPATFSLKKHDCSGHKLLYVGRLAAAKGLPILLQSIATLKINHPDLSLIVVGDGGERAELEATVERLEIAQHVEFVGYKSRAEVRDYLLQSDMLVLPSFAEGVPVVLMEAMAAGVPVVSTRIAGIAELVEEGVSGFLVPPGDVACLNECISTLLQDRQLRAQFGAAGRAKVAAEFNINLEVQWLHRILSSHQTEPRTALSGKRVDTPATELTIRPTFSH